MKPCSNNRQRISMMALGGLDSRQDQELRAHLKICEGCRRHLVEILAVTEKLAATSIEPDIQVSENFHQKLVGRLQAEPDPTLGERIAVYFETILPKWNLAAAAIAAAVLLLAGTILFMRPQHSSVALPSHSPQPPAVTQSKSLANSDPTLSNYQIAARKSPEKLDELLARQEKKHPSPMPVYTASMLALGNGALWTEP